MWQKCRTFVSGVIAPINAIGEIAGRLAAAPGSEIFVSVIPSRRTRCSQVSSMRP